MNYFRYYLVWASAGLLIFNSPCHGQSDNSWDDPAFNQLVNINLLVESRSRLDSSGLVDAALLFSKAEDILLRSHRSGVKSGDLLLLATNTAKQKKDEKSLKRLARLAEREDLKQLAKRVEMAQAADENGETVDKSVSLEGSVEDLIASWNAHQKDLREAASEGLPEAARAALAELGTTRSRGLKINGRTYIKKRRKDGTVYWVDQHGKRMPPPPFQ